MPWPSYEECSRKKRQQQAKLKISRLRKARNTVFRLSNIKEPSVYVRHTIRTT